MHNPYNRECPNNKNRDSKNPFANIACHCDFDFPTGGAMKSAKSTECCKKCISFINHSWICNGTCSCHSPQVKSEAEEVKCKGGNPVPHGKLGTLCTRCGYTYHGPESDEWEKMSEIIYAQIMRSCRCSQRPVSSKEAKELLKSFITDVLSKARQQSYNRGFDEGLDYGRPIAQEALLSQIEKIIDGMILYRSGENVEPIPEQSLGYNSALDDIKNKLAKLKE